MTVTKKKAPAAKGAKPTAKAVKASGKARTPAKTKAASSASKTFGKKQTQTTNVLHSQPKC